MDSRFKNLRAIIVKVTNRCNINCSYCYESTFLKGGSNMSIDIFKSLIDKVIENSVNKVISIIFHGGEPTLISTSWYEEAIYYCHIQGQKSNRRFRFSMQTNFVNVPDVKLYALNKLGISFGISLDGPSSLPSMRAKVESVINKFNVVRENGVFPGVLMSINQLNFDSFLTIMKWADETLKVKSIKANVVSSVGNAYDTASLSADQIFKAKRDIIDYMIQTNGESLVETNTIDEIIRFFSSKNGNMAHKSTLCKSMKCGAGKTVIGININGEIFPCGRFSWDDSEYILGRVEDNVLSSILRYQDKIEGFHIKQSDNWKDCQTCQANTICSFGCQAFILRSRKKINNECEPTKMQFQYIIDNENKLFDVCKNYMNKKSISFDDYNDYSDRDYNDYSDYSDYKDYSDYIDYIDEIQAPPEWTNPSLPSIIPLPQPIYI